MVKLKRVKTQGMASQMGLLRFSEDLAEGPRWEPIVIVVFALLFAAIEIALNFLV